MPRYDFIEEPGEREASLKSIRCSLRGAVAAALLACMACGGGYSAAGSGPPDYAPAHGYRYRQGHTVMVYDERVSAYRVTQYRDVYYSGGHYYRLRGGSWYSAPRATGGWVLVKHESVPPGLAKKYEGKYKDKDTKEAKKSTKYKQGHGKKGY